MKFFRSFYKQFQWCHKNKVMVIEDKGICGHIHFICRIYSKFCNSGNCREEREKIKTCAKQ